MGEKIAIISNSYLSLYGICATTILYRSLINYGIQSGYYIPNRFKEGYGLNEDIVENAYQKGYSLIITVDNGVKSFEAIEYAKNKGIDVIVSDHHDYDEKIECTCFLHSFEMGEDYKYYSGAAIALGIARALKMACKDDVVLACIALLADVMQLKKETRIIVKYGIKYLNEGCCLPIQCLPLQKIKNWNEEVIAFQVIPKINCMGRLADRANVNTMVRYLLCDNYATINDFAKQVSKLNDDRKTLSNEMYQKAKSLVKDEYGFQLLFDDSFHEGIVGLVANRLCQEYQKPVMVASIHHNCFKGSIRSDGSIDLRDFFNDFKDNLETYGGHEKAAGISLLRSNKQKIQDFVNNKMKMNNYHYEASYDVIDMDINSLTINDVISLDELRPYGEGFDEPLFIFRNVEVKSCKAMGKDMHTKWVINDEIEAILFNSKAFLDHRNDVKYQFIANLSINEFRGVKKISLKVKEYQLL